MNRKMYRIPERGESKKRSERMFRDTASEGDR